MSPASEVHRQAEGAEEIGHGVDALQKGDGAASKSKLDRVVHSAAGQEDEGCRGGDPLSESCQGPGVAPAPNAPARSEEVRQLILFRDCSEAKARELGTEAKKRASAKVGATAQLHSMIKDVTKITTDSIELLTEFREQAKDAQQTKCWLRGTIQDCGR